VTVIYVAISGSQTHLVRQRLACNRERD